MNNTYANTPPKKPEMDPDLAVDGTARFALKHGDNLNPPGPQPGSGSTSWPRKGPDRGPHYFPPAAAAAELPKPPSPRHLDLTGGQMGAGEMVQSQPR